MKFFCPRVYAHCTNLKMSKDVNFSLRVIIRQQLIIIGSNIAEIYFYKRFILLTTCIQRKKIVSLERKNETQLTRVKKFWREFFILKPLLIVQTNHRYSSYPLKKVFDNRVKVFYASPCTCRSLNVVIMTSPNKITTIIEKKLKFNASLKKKKYLFLPIYNPSNLNSR